VGSMFAGIVWAILAILLLSFIATE